MKNEQLRGILVEYPMSLRLNVIVEKETRLETTVAEMVCKLIGKTPDGLLTFCGRSDCILRERVEESRDPNHLGPTLTKWLEMDMR